MDREAWCAVIYGVTKSRTWLNDWTEPNIFSCFSNQKFLLPLSCPPLHLYLLFCCGWSKLSESFFAILRLEGVVCAIRISICLCWLLLMCTAHTSLHSSTHRPASSFSLPSRHQACPFLILIIRSSRTVESWSLPHAFWEHMIHLISSHIWVGGRVEGSWSSSQATDKTPHSVTDTSYHAGRKDGAQNLQVPLVS